MSFIFRAVSMILKRLAKILIVETIIEPETAVANYTSQYEFTDWANGCSL